MADSFNISNSFNSMGGYPITDYRVEVDESGIKKYYITLMLRETDFRYIDGDPMVILRQKAVEAIKYVASRYNVAIGEVGITNMQVVRNINDGDDIFTIQATGMAMGIMYMVPDKEQTIQVERVNLYDNTLKELLGTGGGFSKFDEEANKISEQINEGLGIPIEALEPGKPKLKSMVIESEITVHRNIRLVKE